MYSVYGKQEEVGKMTFIDKTKKPSVSHEDFKKRKFIKNWDFTIFRIL